MTSDGCIAQLVVAGNKEGRGGGGGGGGAGAGAKARVLLVYSTFPHCT